MIILEKKIEKKNKFTKLNSDSFCSSDIKEFTILNLDQWDIFKKSKKKHARESGESASIANCS